jgi:hypothetical protein
MDQYALILRHPDGKKVASPDQLDVWKRQTKAWILTMQAQNKFVSGTGLLFDEARVVKPKGRVFDGPYGSGEETIGGYLIIKAESIAEAVEFAKGCPVIQGEGNSVEIRKIAPPDHLEKKS